MWHSMRRHVVGLCAALFLAALALPAVASTPTPGPTPTPKSQNNGPGLASNLSHSSRALSDMKVGERLLALWMARQTGGALGVSTPSSTPGATYDIASGTYVINGIYVPAATAAASAAKSLSGVTTTSTQFKKVTVCVDAAGTYTQVVGAAATSQAKAIKLNCRDDATEVAYIEVPNSFTGGTTTVTAGMLKQTPTRASQAGGNVGQF